MKYVLLICAVFLCLIITFDLFLKEPPVWPDEAGLANFSTQVEKDLLNYYQVYPSVYIVGLHFWFNIFGVSIINQRLFSILGGLLTVIIFIQILNNLNFKNSIFKIIGVILLITDFTFLQSTRVGRPEIWTLSFGLLSLYFYLKYINSEFKKYVFLILSLFSSAVAFLFHMNGIIFTLIILIVSIINYKKIISLKFKDILVLLVIILPVLIWVASRFVYFYNSLLSRFKIGLAQDTWIVSIFTAKPLELKLIYLSFILITVISFIFYLKSKTNKLLIIIFSLLFSWALMLFNRDFWYAVFIIPFIILALTILLDHFLNNRSKFIGLIGLLIILLLSNTKFHFDILISEGGDKYSYEKYISDIKNIIPDNKTVFNSSIPTTYYAFVEKNNKYESFPQGFVDITNYIDVLNNTDYIIFNGSYGDNYYGDLVVKYVDKNKLNITKIGEPSQYQAYIIELKSKDKRETP